MDVSFPFHPEHVPLKSAFLSGSDHTSIVSEEEVESRNDIHSDSDLPSTCDESIIESITLEDPFDSCGFDSNDVLGEGIDEELYPSANVTLMQALAILFAWFSSFPGLSKEAFHRLLYLLHTFLLPAGNKLPPSYYKAHAMISKKIVPVEEYDCCVNDCVLFRNTTSVDYSNMTKCPKCGEDRYEPYSRIARKRFKYVPIQARLRRMFGNKTMSKHLQSHMHINATRDDVGTLMSDLHQSPAWISKYDDNGPFEGDPRGISLALCTDGMNPFSKENTTYSMWPITLTILNLPRHLRNLAGSMLLAGIIPGKSERKNIDPYIDVLLDELEQINGSDTYDGYHEANFQMKAELFLHVLDYPGQNKLFHCQGKPVTYT